jgi:hypothetical protein
MSRKDKIKKHRESLLHVKRLPFGDLGLQSFVFGLMRVEFTFMHVQSSSRFLFTQISFSSDCWGMQLGGQPACMSVNLIRLARSERFPRLG